VRSSITTSGCRAAVGEAPISPAPAGTARTTGRGSGTGTSIGVSRACDATTERARADRRGAATVPHSGAASFKQTPCTSANNHAAQEVPSLTRLVAAMNPPPVVTAKWAAQ
jgi:hypothetical protein